MTDLSALIARVERLTEPDREVDAELWALGGLPPHWTLSDAALAHKTGVAAVLDAKQEAIGGLNWRHTLGLEKDPFFHVARYTASIDAAVALCERLLPGWDCFVRKDSLPNCFHYGWVSLRAEDDGTGGGYEQAHGSTPALALVAATLRALSATAPGDGTNG